MTSLIAFYDRLTASLNALGVPILATAARLVFAAVLLRYFWASAATKLDGLFTPSVGAYAQIFPRQIEAVGYDASQLSAFHWLVVMAGSYAEIILPALIVLGLFSRLAAVGMAGFIIVQSLTDIVGHGADAATIGALFDRTSDALILDQRTLWMLPLMVIVMLGAGPLSLDRLLSGQRARALRPA